jgi:uncharacterized damage-inducible protein DinB
MSNKTEAQVLAEGFETSRYFMNMYLNVLKDTDTHKTFEINGQKLNSIIWLRAHIAWGHHVWLKLTNGPTLKNNWIEKFHTSSDPTPQPDWPSFDEVRQALDEQLLLIKQHLPTLSGDDLSRIVTLAEGLSMPARNAIHLNISHEALHTGQIAWIAKANGIKVV